MSQFTSRSSEVQFADNDIESDKIFAQAEALASPSVTDEPATEDPEDTIGQEGAASDWVPEASEIESDKISTRPEALGGLSVTDEPAAEDTEDSIEGEKTASDPDVSKPEPDF